MARKKKDSGFFIQEATDRMAKKGTLGAFGKATPKKIAAGKRRGGLQKKRAVFAENMRAIAARRKRGGGKSR
jgi:hypothetical protein